MTESILRPIAQCGKCLATVEPNATFCDSCGSFFADARMIAATGLPESSSVKLTRSGELKFQSTEIQSGSGMCQEIRLLGCPYGKVRVCRSVRVRYPNDITQMDFSFVVNGLYQHGAQPSVMFTMDDSGNGGMTDFGLLFNPVSHNKHSSGVFPLENVVLVDGSWIELRGNDATTANNYTSVVRNPMEWVVEYFEHDRGDKNV